MDKQNTGLRFKLARVRRGLHLYEVARRVGISPSRLSQFEGGHKGLPLELEEKLRAVLGIPQKRRKEHGQPEA